MDVNGMFWFIFIDRYFRLLFVTALVIQQGDIALNVHQDWVTAEVVSLNLQNE